MRGISAVERHFEKAVAGLVVACIGGFLAWDFLSPEEFKMGSNSSVTPATANEILLNKAIALSREQASETTIELDPVQKGASKEAFLKKITTDLSDPARLPANYPSLAKKIIVPDIRSLDTWYYEPRFTAPTMASPVEWFGDSLVEKVVAANEPLKTFVELPGNGLDVIWTRPVAHVDLKAIRNELGKEDKGANPPRLASIAEWRKNAVYFLDVVFERQERKEDGSWAEAQEVPPMLGFEGKLLREKLRGTGSKSLDSNAIFASMRGENSIEKTIRQPDFYETTYGTGSVSASKASATGSGASASSDKRKQQSIEKKKEELLAKEKELAAAEKELQSFGGLWTQQKEDAKKAAAKKEEDRIRKENKNNPNATPPPKTDLKIPQWKKISKEVLALQKSIGVLRSELGIELEAPDESKVAKPAPKPVETDADSIDVWTHDLQAPLGKTVRYRCRIDIYNPFFGKERQLVQQQKPLAVSPVLSTPFSEWSSPVSVPGKTMYFAENGTLESTASGAKSSVFFNVYVLKNGLWQKTDPNPSFESGQPLIFPLTFKDKAVDGKNTPSTAEVDSGWFVVDIVDDPNAFPEKNRATLPGVVLSRRDGTGKFEIRYPSLEQKETSQDLLKKLVEEAKSLKPAAVAAE